MNRRDFVAKGTAILGLTRKGVASVFYGSSSDVGAPEAGTGSQLEQISQHVNLYRDVVNVGVIAKNGKTLLIDSGDATILRETKALRLGSI
jgi:hypothetical protein